MHPAGYNPHVKGDYAHRARPRDSKRPPPDQGGLRPSVLPLLQERLEQLGGCPWCSHARVLICDSTGAVCTGNLLPHTRRGNMDAASALITAVVAGAAVRPIHYSALASASTRT